MPAAAVIPAELEMGNIVAVKTYVVTFVYIALFNEDAIERTMTSYDVVNSASKLERLT